jgi:GTPase Era involved in 16S rRNA processing
VKWEFNAGKIIENQLFVDDYHMIVAIRIGDTMPGRIGKSTILNQLLSSQNTFSSIAEPLAERGKPLTIDVEVEFVCLTQEIATPKLWDTVLKKNYESGDNKIILLANLHGDALDHPFTISYLSKIASSFIVFLMADQIENSTMKCQKLEEIINWKDDTNIFYVVVDPPTDCFDYDEDQIIDSSKISNDVTMRKLRDILKFTLESNPNSISYFTDYNSGYIKPPEIMQTNESIRMIEYVETTSCESIRKFMKILGESTNFPDVNDMFMKNYELKKFIDKFSDILLLPLDKRIIALSHLENKLGRIASEESRSARLVYMNELESSQKFSGSRMIDTKISQQSKQRVNEALRRIENKNLGLEHFYRYIGRLYELFLIENPKDNPMINLAKSYAELMIAGQAIELLNGDTGSICGSWLRAICNQVTKNIPELRIFVISILGLQSSGKSTLLNALFGCKFAVSVGRCTRGLFMRLLFLDVNLRKRMNYDAILLIDTEGLGAPEKQNEIDSEIKDRILATYVMGVSHLTIVNVLGEYMRDLTEILQIAIVAIARLEKVDISPDLLIAQHLTERNAGKISIATKQISESLENALKICDERDKKLNLMNSKYFETLRRTIASGKLFRQFRPYKNGATVDSPPSDEYHQDVVELYKSLINIAENSKELTYFKDWQELVQIYWDELKNENLMRLKDIKKLQEFMQKGDKVSKLKEAIEFAFREHSNEMKIFVSDQAKRMNNKEITREQVLKMISEKLRIIPCDCSLEPRCDHCLPVRIKQSELYALIENKPNESEMKIDIWSFIVKTRETTMKLMSQSFSAMAFRQITSADILERIDSELRKMMKMNQNMTEQQVKKIGDEIWRNIEKEADSQVIMIPFVAVMKEEISKVYCESPTFIIDFERKIIDTFRDKSAISKSFISRAFDSFLQRDSDRLTYIESNDMEKYIEIVSKKIIDEEKAFHYINGMIAKLKYKVDEMIEHLERTCFLKFRRDFKMMIHLFANQKFCKLVETYQIKWDEYNNPLTILRRNKSQYMSIILERLERGFNIESDGNIIANCLINAIKQKAIDSANRQRIQDVLDISWLINSENVRLKYFFELVEQIQNSEFSQALNHFNDPKCQIEIWFMNKVDMYTTGKEYDKFNNVYFTELNQVLQDIKLSKNFTEARNYFETYISSIDGINIPSLTDIEDGDQMNFGIFIDKIHEILSSGLENLPTISKNDLIRPSYDNQVIDRLGCTHACPLCSALCWGQSKHHEDRADINKHHTCHQPMGLSGTYFRSSSMISTEICHDIEKSTAWNIDDKKVSWGEVMKFEKYKTWRYEIHYNRKFNNLMKWFFLVLNDKIAERYGKIAAKAEDIDSLKINSLDIRSILAEIYQKI